MLDISEELKQLYKNDLIPVIASNIPKELILYFPEIDLTVETDRIVDDSFELSESICSDEDLTLGSCESAKLKITVADVDIDLKGQIMIVTQIVNGIHEMPLGEYVVDSVIKQSDLRFKDITAYDAMKSADIDVSAWYQGLTFPITKKAMLHSLLNHLGIAFELQTLPNDDVSLEKTINPSYLKGRDVLYSLCELSGGFGHIKRTNTFKVVQLSGLGLYPSETFYPSEDLFPAESNEFISAGYMESDYEEYLVEPITGVKIVQDDEDYGTMVGTSDNIYTVTGNFLLYGKSSTELKSIAENILLVLKNKYYRPHTTTMIGLPYIEVGDAINIITTDDAIETFVFQRTLKGIQSLVDEMSATGNKFRTNIPSPNNEIQQMKGKYLNLVKTIDEVSSTITNVEKNLTTKIKQTEDEISQSVTDLDKNLKGQIKVLSEEVELKVDANGVITAINVSPGVAKIKANKIEFEGTVTANGNFKINTDGTIEAINGKFSGTVEGATIKGSAFETYGNDGYFISSAWDSNQHGTWNLEVRIQNGEIEVGRTLYTTTGQTFEKSTIINYNRISSNRVYGTEVQGETADFKELTLGTTGGAGKVIFNSNYEFRPQIFSTNCKIGSSSYPWTEGHFKKIYSNGVEVGTFDEKSIKALYPQSNSNSYYAYLNTSREFIPSTSSSSYPFYLGNLNYPWNTLYVNSIRMVGSGGSLAFFNATPSARKSISKLSNTSSITAGAVADKLNELFTELNSKGLISSS